MVASSSSTLTFARVYQQRAPWPPAVAAVHVGTFADVFGEQVGEAIPDWPDRDGADVLNAFFSASLLSLNWFFTSYRGGLDCYTLYYPRPGPQTGDVYRHFHVSGFHHTRDWYLASPRRYTFVGRLARRAWALRELDVGDFISTMPFPYLTED